MSEPPDQQDFVALLMETVDDYVAQCVKDERAPMHKEFAVVLFERLQEKAWLRPDGTVQPPPKM
jgi:hypothetical protein